MLFNLQCSRSAEEIDKAPEITKNPSARLCSTEDQNTVECRCRNVY